MKARSPLLLLTLLVLALQPSSRAQTPKPDHPATAREWWRQSSEHRPRANPEVNVLPRIKVQGNRFVDATGERIIFRGFSIADPDVLENEGHWNRQLFESIKDMGATILRLPVHPAAWRACTPEKYVLLLDQAIGWCTEMGIYVIIDWHSIGNLQTDLYQAPMYNTSRAETSAFWRTISERYARNSTVAFYELYNEPTTFRGTLGRSSWTEWRKINEDLIALIRSADKEAIPLVAGFDWAYDLTPIIEDPIRASGIGYVVHPYPNKRPQPWEPRWEENFAFAAAQYPVIATEIGFGLHPGETVTDDHYGNRITRFLEGHGISWLAWVYDPNWGPQMLKSWDGFQLTGAGEFFKQALHRPIAGPAEKTERKAGDY